MDISSQQSTFVLEEIDAQSHRVREVYALHGLCMFLSQGLESIMSILLAGCYFSRPAKMTRQKYDAQLEAGFRRTFGVTVNEWCKHEKDQDLCSRLKKAIKTRNWLAHRYFWDRTGHFVNEEGVEFMRNELTEIRDELQELDKIFHQKASDHNKKIGISEDILESLALEIEKEAIAHMRGESPLPP